MIIGTYVGLLFQRAVFVRFRARELHTSSPVWTIQKHKCNFKFCDIPVPEFILSVLFNFSLIFHCVLVYKHLWPHTEAEDWQLHTTLHYSSSLSVAVQWKVYNAGRSVHIKVRMTSWCWPKWLEQSVQNTVVSCSHYWYGHAPVTSWSYICHCAWVACPH